MDSITETQTDSNNLAAFAGTPNSVKQELDVQGMDISLAEEQAQSGDEIKDAAQRIYDNGEALTYMIDTCQRSHVGDKIIITGLILSFAGTYVSNNEIGLNVRITGDAGSGKTHVANTVKKIIPGEYMKAAQFTDASLLYMEDGELKPGSVIYTDDQTLTEKAGGIMKSQTSDVNEPFLYYTVVNHKTEMHSIPERCVRWSVLADSSGLDDQTADRELFFFAENSPEHIKQITDHKAEEDMNPDLKKDTTHIDTSRKIWSNISRDSTVVIPFSKRIDADDSEKLRTRALFTTMIRASAVLHAPIREKTEKGYIIADEADFNVAANVMNPILKGIHGSQKHKLTKQQERILTEFLEKHESKYYLFKDIRDALNISESQLSQAINGRNDITHHSDGLLKIPGISKRQDRDGNKYLEWDRDAYRRWDGSKAFFTLKDAAQE